MIKKILSVLLSFTLLTPNISFATIAATTMFEMRQDSTANMVNGGGFNYGNTNFPTDASWSSANTNAPTFTSATHNCVAGDVGAYVYSKNTTNVGFYPITACNSGTYTVDATIGHGEILANGRWQPSTVVGVDSSASVSSKTYGIDYSRKATAIINGITDFASVGSSTNLTSATAGFHGAMVGNFFHLTTTGTGAFGLTGWYEIVSYTNATTIVTDRTTNNGTALVAGTGYVAGSLDMAGTLMQVFMTQLVAGNIVWFKYNASAYTMGTSVTSSPNGTAALPIAYYGYNTYRGDNPTANLTTSTAPSITVGFLRLTGAFNYLSNIRMTTSGIANTEIETGADFYWNNFSVLNTSTTAANSAIQATGAGVLDNFEAVSYNGIAVVCASAPVQLKNAYIHDSLTGINLLQTSTTASAFLDKVLIVHNTNGITITGAAPGNINLNNVTLYGAATPTGTGISITNTAGVNLQNVSISGFVTGISAASGQGLTYSDYNNYYNNTTDVTNWLKGPHDIAVNPTFTNVGEITGSGASITTTTLTDGSASFNGKITDNQDILHITSITTGTVQNLLITGHTNTTLTLSGSDTGTNVVYYIPNKHNFATGYSLMGKGFPGTFMGGLTTSKEDIGAVKKPVQVGVAF